MFPKIDTEFSNLFRKRKRHFALQGYRGRQLLEALAADPELDVDITTEDAAVLLDILPVAMQLRRKRGDPPTYTRHPSGRVTYTLHDILDLLIAGTVEPKSNKEVA